VRRVEQVVAEGAQVVVVGEHDTHVRAGGAQHRHLALEQLLADGAEGDASRAHGSDHEHDVERGVGHHVGARSAVDAAVDVVAPVDVDDREQARDGTRRRDGAPDRRPALAREDPTRTVLCIDGNEAQIALGPVVDRERPGAAGDPRIDRRRTRLLRELRNRTPARRVESLGRAGLAPEREDLPHARQIRPPWCRRQRQVAARRAPGHVLPRREPRTDDAARGGPDDDVGLA